MGFDVRWPGCSSPRIVTSPNPGPQALAALEMPHVMINAGYARNGSQWVCTDTYVGTPVEAERIRKDWRDHGQTCTASSCGQPVELSGCLP